MNSEQSVNFCIYHTNHTNKECGLLQVKRCIFVEWGCISIYNDSKTRQQDGTVRRKLHFNFTQTEANNKRRRAVQAQEYK